MWVNGVWEEVINWEAGTGEERDQKRLERWTQGSGMGTLGIDRNAAMLRGC